MNTENFFSHLYLDICLGIEERNKMSTMSDGAKICLNWYFKHVNASVFCRLFNLCLTHILLFISVSKCYVSFSYITHSFKSKKTAKNLCIIKNFSDYHFHNFGYQLYTTNYSFLNNNNYFPLAKVMI